MATLILFGIFFRLPLAARAPREDRGGAVDEADTHTAPPPRERPWRGVVDWTGRGRRLGRLISGGPHLREPCVFETAMRWAGFHGPSREVGKRARPRGEDSPPELSLSLSLSADPG